MSEKPIKSRRQFVKLGALALAAAPVSRFLGGDPASAQGLPRLEENDPIALELGYLHDANQVDVEKYPRRAGSEGAKQFCDNCQFFGQPDAEGWGACTIIPGKLVKDKGWCNAWGPMKTG